MQFLLLNKMLQVTDISSLCQYYHKVILFILKAVLYNKISIKTKSNVREKFNHNILTLTDPFQSLRKIRTCRKKKCRNLFAK